MKVKVYCLREPATAFFHGSVRLLQGVELYVSQDLSFLVKLISRNLLKTRFFREPFPRLEHLLGFDHRRLVFLDAGLHFVLLTLQILLKLFLLFLVLAFPFTKLSFNLSELGNLLLLEQQGLFLLNPPLLVWCKGELLLLGIFSSRLLVPLFA